MTSLEASVISGLARTLYVLAWAEHEGEEGRTYPGEELSRLAPPTPATARDVALKLAGRFEQANDVGLLTLLWWAAMADGLPEDLGRIPDRYAEEFGHALALQALGAGAGWFDSHAGFPLVVPRFECTFEELVPEDGEATSPLTCCDLHDCGATDAECGWIGGQRPDEEESFLGPPVLRREDSP